MQTKLTLLRVLFVHTKLKPIALSTQEMKVTTPRTNWATSFPSMLDLVSQWKVQRRLLPPFPRESANETVFPC